MRWWLWIAYWACLSTWAYAQPAKEVSQTDTLMNRVARQLALFPQEKIQVQLDRGIYFPGDTLWMKPYVVHATFHTPMQQSRYVYAELINPLDSVIGRIKLRADSGNFQGYIPLPYQLPEGNYTLRAYTRYMQVNQPADLFQRPVYIRTAPWANIGLKVKSLVDKKGGNKLSMEFLNGASVPIFPKQANIHLKDGSVVTLPTQGSLLEPAFSAKTLAENRNLLLEFKDSRGEQYQRFFGLTTDKEDYDVSFYPEGGYLLAGVNCRVAFKALGQSGHPAQVLVQVVDSKDNVVASATVMHAGMGVFDFVPKAGEPYYARCANRYGLEKKLDLPKVQKASYGLKVTSSNDKLLIALQSAVEAPANSLYLLAHVRGVVVYADWWKPGNKQYLFDARMFPSGVVQWLLLDKAMNPLSERLVFVDHGDPLNYQWHTDKKVYGRREQVMAQLQINGLQQALDHGSISVSVTEAPLADTAYNIRSTLLLTSELRGTIENPAFYLQGDSLAHAATDLLMMVHGWRRYQLPAMMKGQLEQPKSAAETAFQISGKVKPVFAFETAKKFTITITGTNNTYIDEATTDKNRRFVFKGVDFPDGMGFDLRAIRDAGYTPNEIQVLVDKTVYPPMGEAMPQMALLEAEDDTVQVQRPEDSLFRQGMRHYQLQEVEVNASYWGGSDYLRFNAREVSRTPYKDMRGLLEYMGLKVSADEIYYKGKKILTFVDDAHCHSSLAVLYYLSLSDVEDIVLIKDAARSQVNDLLEPGRQIPIMRQKMDNLEQLDYAKALDSLAVLNITTKAGFDSRFLGKYDYLEDRVATAKRTIYPLGFQQPVTFYAPRYDTADQKAADEVDFRATRYWNPNLRVDANGQTSFSFYTGDTPGVYKAIVEGISDKGEIVYAVKEILVK